MGPVPAKGVDGKALRYPERGEAKGFPGAGGRGAEECNRSVLKPW